MTTILNDLHLGTQRQAGTTPATQIALKQFIRDSFRDLVAKADDHLILNGDIFDGFTVDPSEVIFAYETLCDYIHDGGQVTLCMGNHDYSPKADKVSSFHLLAHILTSRFEDKVQVVDHTKGFTLIQDKPEIRAVPHMPNQTLFDMEIEKAVSLGSDEAYLLLHCNVESPFAEHADHSLNLSEEQSDALVDAGWTLVVAHEHQARYLRGKKVIVTGNQIVTSVSDCLHNPANKKQMLRISDEGWDAVPVLDLDEVFACIDWRSLADVPENAKFIRVEGDCTADEAADMVSVISKLRQRHPAYVISNAVKVEGVAQMDGLAQLSAENISKFNVLEALLEELTEEEGKVVKELLQ